MPILMSVLIILWLKEVKWDALWAYRKHSVTKLNQRQTPLPVSEMILRINRDRNSLQIVYRAAKQYALTVLMQRTL